MRGCLDLSLNAAGPLGSMEPGNAGQCRGRVCGDRRQRGGLSRGNEAARMWWCSGHGRELRFLLVRWRATGSADQGERPPCRGLGFDRCDGQWRDRRREAR